MLGGCGTHTSPQRATVVGLHEEEGKERQDVERRAVKSTMRTFEVLELFEVRRRPLRLQDVHQALGYPQSSATNLLKSMVLTGYLNYNRTTRTYLPTTKVSTLGNWLPGFIHYDGRHHHLIEKLQRRTDETVILVGLNDLFVQYLIVCEPEHEHKSPPTQGGLRMLVDSVGGIALLSTLTDREVDKICRYTNYYELNRGEDSYRETGYERVSTEEIMSEVRWARQVGYSYRPAHPLPTLAALAVPLRSGAQGIPLAIGIGGLRDRIGPNKQDLLNAARETVKEFEAGDTGPFDAAAAPTPD